MSEQVSWIIKMNIRAGKLNDFKTLVNEMVEATNKHETGAQSYEWYLNEDETQCHIYEKYENSQAVLTHLGAFGENFASRFMASVEPTGLTVYGNPNDKARSALKGLAPVYFSRHIGGFTR